MINDMRIDTKILSSHLFRLIRVKTGKTEAECFLGLFKAYSYLINCSNKDGVVKDISESFLDDIAGLAGFTSCLVETGRISVIADGMIIIDIANWISHNHVRRSKYNKPVVVRKEDMENDAFVENDAFCTSNRIRNNVKSTSNCKDFVYEKMHKMELNDNLASNTTTQNDYKNVTSSEISENFMKIENPLRSIDSSNVFSIGEEDNKRKEITLPIVPLYKEKQNHRNVSRNTLNNFSEFQEFWNTYRKKVDRVKCERAFAKLTPTELQAIKEKLPRYVALTPDPQYRKNPLTWLNGKCWQDDFEHSINSTQNENILLNQNQMDYTKGFEDL